MIECERLEGGVVRMTLSRPPVNALSADGLMKMATTLDDLAGDNTVKAVVINSTYKVFSAGLDLKEAQQFTLEQQHAIVKGLNVGFLRLFAFPKPTVAAVNGAAIAGGLFFVLASDYRVAAPRSAFGLAEIRVGADFPAGPLEIARATLGPNALRRLMLTGQPVRAELAAQMGIVDEIVDDETLQDRAVQVAQQMADLPPKTFASVKTQIRGETIARVQAAMAAGANAPEYGWFTDETIPAMQRMIG
ncbi:enoyl-CoA hydratase/isomerase family protein [Arenibacterium sp. CAU 1754]